MKRHALFVGVNDYADDSFKNLRYSVSDAAALSGAFAARGFDTSVLTNPKADEIIGAVERHTAGLGSGDVFLFFFAGHGFTAPDGSHLLICANDKLSFLRHNRAGIPVDLLEEVTNGRGFHRAFLLDACRTDVFAGVDSRGAETRDLALVSLPDAKVNAGTCCVLRSCDRFCPAMEFEDLGHGVFTRAVMDVLGDDSACAIPFGETFVSGIRSRMRGILSAHGVPADQNPCFQTNGEAFFLFDVSNDARKDSERLGGASSGRGRSPSAPPQPHTPARPEVSPHLAGDSAAQEAEVLRRKLSLSRALKAIPYADRVGTEFFKFVSTAEDEFAVAEEAIHIDKFAVAAESLGRAETALEELRKAREDIGKVQLWAGGPYWSTRNIGADKPEDYGLYFWWGDTIGYRHKGDAWVASDGSNRNFSFSEKSTHTYGKDEAPLKCEGGTIPAGILAPAHDAAHVHWGGDWRMPTKQEFDDLNSKCDWTWTTMNGAEGYVVRGRGAYADFSIFLPAAGRGNETSLVGVGSLGYYWSSVPHSDYNGSWYLYFGTDDHYTNGYYSFIGQSVRPVLDVAK